MPTVDVLPAETVRRIEPVCLGPLVLILILRSTVACKACMPTRQVLIKPIDSALTHEGMLY
ncbi:MAG: hypothetical protein A4E20_08645 [Nitrospira sp. SG-bin2]|nr:MAG: hypothetical protein A4E20_08645 [Nitrospira sp. SG-bin2]